ncbi:hypothetical protein K439DRAFT_1640628 [Ramaria rubella]|nr:hypothetical protein K439DRAFT_1640628 [Ramaria rubella]
MCLYCLISNQLIRELTHKCQAFEQNLSNSSPLLPADRHAGDLGRRIRQVLHGHASEDFIVTKLHEHGYETMAHIGTLQDSDLMSMGMRKGHIAQLRDAVKAWSIPRVLQPRISTHPIPDREECALAIENSDACAIEESPHIAIRHVGKSASNPSVWQHLR